MSRPPIVSAATWVALTCSALCFVVFSVVAGTFVVARDDFVDALEERAADEPDLAGLDPEQAASTAIVVTFVFAVWSLAAVLFAVLAMRRSRLGRVLLVFSACASAAVSLVGGVAFGLPFLLCMASVAVVIMLLGPTSNAWFTRRGEYADVPPVGTTRL